MKPNKSHIILKIFGFLIFSIGILYICQFFTKSLEEGFAIPPGCNVTYDSDRKLVLCESVEKANMVFDDIAVNLPGKNDNVCVPYNSVSSYYTCYTRPAQKVYNDVYGIYRDFDPVNDKDTMPEDLSPSIDIFCASYNANTVKVIRGISSTKAVLNNITKTVISTTIYKDLIRELKNSYCNPVRPGMERACPYITIADTSINNLQGASDLTVASNTVSASLNSLSNISTQMFTLYNGSKCNTTPGYILGNI